MVPTVVGEIVIRAFKLYASEVRSIEGDLAQREGETGKAHGEGEIGVRVQFRLALL